MARKPDELIAELHVCIRQLSHVEPRAVKAMREAAAYIREERPTLSRCKFCENEPATVNLNGVLACAACARQVTEDEQVETGLIV